MAKKTRNEDVEQEQVHEMETEGPSTSPAEPEVHPEAPTEPVSTLPQIEGTPYFARRVTGKVPPPRLATSRYAHRAWIRAWKQQVLMRGFR